MTDKQKRAILTINEVKEKGYIDEEAYIELLELIMQTPQYVPYPIEMPNHLAYPLVTYQSTCKADIK